MVGKILLENQLTARLKIF